MKLLFVHYIQMGDEDQTGKTLAHIFDGIEDVSIMQYCLNPYAKEYGVFPTIRTDIKESVINSIVQKLINKGYGKTGTRTLNSMGNGNTSAKNLTLKKRIYTDMRNFLLFLRNVSNPRINKNNLKKIKAFSPDIIYTLDGNVFALRVVNNLAKSLKIPVVIHSMDDLMHTNYMGNDWKQKLLRYKFEKEMKKAYSLSCCGIAISQKMADAYSAELKIPFYHAMNCIDTLHYKPRKADHDILIIFSGGVHGGRDSVIKQLGSDIEEFNNHSENDKFRLEVYTNPYGRKLLSGISSQYVTINAYVDENRMYDNLQRADVLLHVESFEKANIDYFKYSLSTKIPECLSVGRPLMVIGPEGNGTVDYIKTKNVGWTITDVSGIKSALIDISNKDFEVYSENSLITAGEHLKDVVQQRVKEALQFSIEQHNN